MKVTVINDDIESIPPGKYQTRIVKASWEEIKLEIIGIFNESDPCLLPLIKNGEM